MELHCDSLSRYMLLHWQSLKSLPIKCFPDGTAYQILHVGFNFFLHDFQMLFMSFRQLLGLLLYLLSSTCVISLNFLKILCEPCQDMPGFQSIALLESPCSLQNTMPVKLCYPWDFCSSSLRNRNKLHFSDTLLVEKCLKTQFKMFSFLSYLYAHH